MSIVRSGGYSAVSSAVQDLGVRAIQRNAEATGTGAGAVLNDALTSLTKMALERVKVAGGLISQGIDSNRQSIALLEGITTLSGRGVPGMVSKHITINGQVYEIGVDASAQLNNPNAEPVLIVRRRDDITGEQTQGPIDLDDPELKQHIDAAKNKASADIAEFRLNAEQKVPGLLDQYEQDMADYFRRKRSASAEERESIYPPSDPSTLEAQYIAMIKQTMAAPAMAANASPPQTLPAPTGPSAP